MKEKKDLTPAELKEFDEWCAYGIKGYLRFPVGRTDKLSPNIVAQFIVFKLGCSYDAALNSEYNALKSECGEIQPHWIKQIRNYWMENND